MKPINAGSAKNGIWGIALKALNVAYLGACIFSAVCALALIWMSIKCTPPSEFWNYGEEQAIKK